MHLHCDNNRYSHSDKYSYIRKARCESSDAPSAWIDLEEIPNHAELSFGRATGQWCSVVSSRLAFPYMLLFILFGVWRSYTLLRGEDWLSCTIATLRTHPATTLYRHSRPYTKSTHSSGPLRSREGRTTRKDDPRQL